MEYLGHIINIHRVSANPKKVSAMKEWPLPKTVKELRGFLGLTRYYRRFVKHYGVISKPLTSFLKRDSFQWNDEAQTAFVTLKEAMIAGPVLALPDFTTTFVVEAAASDGTLEQSLCRKPIP